MSLSGSYELVSSENYVGYMKANGCAPELIAMANDLKAILGIVERGDDMDFKVEFGPMKQEFSITLGKEFTDTYPDGRQIKKVIKRVAKNKFHEDQTWVANGFSATEDFDFDDTGLTTTYKWNGGSATQRFKKL